MCNWNGFSRFKFILLEFYVVRFFSIVYENLLIGEVVLLVHAVIIYRFPYFNIFKWNILFATVLVYFSIRKSQEIIKTEMVTSLRSEQKVKILQFQFNSRKTKTGRSNLNCIISVIDHFPEPTIWYSNLKLPIKQW